MVDAVVEPMEENKFPKLSFSCQNVLSLNISTKSSKTDLKIHAVTKSNHDVVILCDTRLNSLKQKAAVHDLSKKFRLKGCSARDWDGKDYLRIIPRVVLVEDPRLT